MFRFVKAACCVVFLYTFPEVRGHGHLWKPPSRSSMWRAGYPVPVNYNDMQLFCGGFSNQWDVNGGLCGVCGDPYQGPYENDYGGTYDTGIIGAVYDEGTTVNIVVNLTAHHLGYFQFRLCDVDGLNGDDLQECLDENVLLLDSQSGLTDRFYPPATGIFTIPTHLPPVLNCPHCVLQWMYKAGNNWGTDEEGQGLGHGPQEHFINCADIQIRPVDGGVTGQPGVTSDQPTTPPVTESPPPAESDETTDPMTCVATGAWAGDESMTQWCQLNCPSNCPPTHCLC